MENKYRGSYSLPPPEMNVDINEEVERRIEHSYRTWEEERKKMKKVELGIKARVFSSNIYKKIANDQPNTLKIISLLFLSWKIKFYRFIVTSD